MDGQGLMDAWIDEWMDDDYMDGQLNQLIDG